MNIPLTQINQKLTDGTIKIAVFGLGRIGLPTALIFADNGVIVYGVDNQNSVIESIKTGKLHIDEPGLPELLEKVINNNHFIATTNYREALENSDVLIICVPTPITLDKVPDYTNIIEVCKNSLQFLKKDDLIVVESTISPSTIEKTIIPIIEQTTNFIAGEDFGIACCPERANPGKILSNFRNVPRIVGGYTEKSAKITSIIYQHITDAEIIQVSDAKTAAAVKLTENIFRDVNIALINELAILYEKLGLDITEIIKAASSKYNFQPHYPGAGVGGPCLPANPYYLIQEAIKVGFVPHLIRMAREINDRMPQHIIELTLETLNQAGRSIKNVKIAVMGVTYKPNVHDFQLSPAIPIVESLTNLGATVSIYDPLIQSDDLSQVDFLKNSTVLDSFDEIIKNSDCIIFVTAHEHFQNLKPEDLQISQNNPLIIIDGRNIFDPLKIPDGIVYVGVGRKKIA